MILTSCSACSRKLKLADNLQGKLIRCPACKGVFRVPAPAAEAAPAVEPAPVAVQPPPAARPAAHPAARPAPRPAPPPEDEFSEEPVRPAPRRRPPPPPEDDFEEAPEVGYDAKRGRRIAKRGALWLQLAFLFDLIPYVIFAVMFFGLTSGTRGRGPADREAQFATGLVILMSAVYLIPVVFLAVGATLLANLKGRGLVITACILSFLMAPQLLVYTGIWAFAFREMARYSTGMVILVPLAISVTSFIGMILNVVAGIRGLMILGKPEVKAAYR
jgi:hypothetical protein